MASKSAAKLIETYHDGAEIHHGEICKEITLKLMEEFSLPKGFLPLDQIEEVGFNRPVGFLWFRLKEKMEHKFKKIGQTVIYNVEITAFIEKGHLSKLTGIKAKEMFVQVVICDVLVGDPTPDAIKFTSPVGISRSHPVSAFELEDGENGGK